MLGASQDMPRAAGLVCSSDHRRSKLTILRPKESVIFGSGWFASSGMLHFPTDWVDCHEVGQEALERCQLGPSYSDNFWPSIPKKSGFIWPKNPSWAYQFPAQNGPNQDFNHVFLLSKRGLPDTMRHFLSEQRERLPQVMGQTHRVWGRLVLAGNFADLDPNEIGGQLIYYTPEV